MDTAYILKEALANMLDHYCYRCMGSRTPESH
jgi:hypothetical protein